VVQHAVVARSEIDWPGVSVVPPVPPPPPVALAYLVATMLDWTAF
jgi:hypothetical protein